MTDQEEKINPRLAGLDWLSFYAFGSYERTDEFFDLLEDNYTHAKSEGSDVGFSYNGVDFTLRSFGGGPRGIYRCQYQLSVAGVYFGVMKRQNLGDDKRPQLKVELKGEILTQLGEKRAIALVKKLFRALGFKYQRSQLSRVDLRCDFVDSFRPHDIYNAWMESRCVSTGSQTLFPVLEGQQCQTFQLGKRGEVPVVLRVYDKLAQALKKVGRVVALEDYVLGCSVGQVQSVTRVEYEIDRDGLRKKFEVDSVEDLLSAMPRFVEKALDYFRVYASKVDRANTTRGTLDPIWCEVKEAFRAFASAFGFRDLPPSKKRKKERQNTTQVKNTVVGYLAKLAAIEGYEVFRSGTALVQFLLDQFADVNESVKAFNSRIVKALVKQSGERLEDAIAILSRREHVPDGMLFT